MRRFGFDLHGVLHPTLTQLHAIYDPEWFVKGIYGAKKVSLEVLRFNLVAFRKHGEVWVISGPPKAEVEDELKILDYEKGVHYDHVRSVVDFLKSTGCEMWQDEKQTWWASDVDWWSAKARICAKYGIELMVDDQERYAPYFKETDTRFHLWQPEKKKLSCAGILTENGNI